MAGRLQCGICQNIPTEKHCLFWLSLATWSRLKPCPAEAFGISPNQKETGVTPKLLGRIYPLFVFHAYLYNVPGVPWRRKRNPYASQRGDWHRKGDCHWKVVEAGWLWLKNRGGNGDRHQYRSVPASSDKGGVTTKGQHFPNSFVLLFLRTAALHPYIPTSPLR